MTTRWLVALALAAPVALSAGAAAADSFVAHYSAYWAGLPAGDVRLVATDEPGSYDDHIWVNSRGLSWLFTHFRGRAESAGQVDGKHGPDPARYDAVYDLHERRDSRISMRFVGRDGAVVAQRGPADTSHQPLLAEKFRTAAIDPLSAIEGIRDAVRRAGGVPGRSFVVPVYDGTRRFDVLGHIVAKDQREHVVRLHVTLRPIAGFKGKTHTNEDPDDGPRPVELTLTDDAHLIPVSMRVPIWFVPLIVRLDYVCDMTDGAPATTTDADSGRRNCRQ